MQQQQQQVTYTWAQSGPYGLIWDQISAFLSRFGTEFFWTHMALRMMEDKNALRLILDQILDLSLIG